MIGRKQLKMMKKEALRVNTARGALVDTGALVDVLADGKIGGASLRCTGRQKKGFFIMTAHTRR